jgi:hypothetical protein
MPTRTSYEHGTFSWVELGTTDVNGAKRFYGELFNWKGDDMPAGPGMTYTMAKLGDHHAAGIYELGKEMRQMGIPPHWMSYISVTNVDDVSKKVAGLGGKVMKEPFDVMDVGRMAVIQDPAGATVALWQAKAHPGAGVVNEPGSLAWNELYTSDVDACVKFYTSLIGWKTESMDMGPMGTYTLFKRSEGKDTNAGGMMKMPPNMQGVPPHWLAYFAVADCDASTEKVKKLGGKVLMEPMDIPDVGRFSVVMDPQGAAFALFKMGH